MAVGTAAALGAAGIAAGAGLIANAGNAAQNYFNREDTQKFNAEEAAKQREFASSEAAIARDWQEHMASTTYQRSVDDMIKAGINPASIGQGMQGSTAPSTTTAGGYGASANVQSGSIYSNVFSSAMQAAMLDNADEIGQGIHQYMLRYHHSTKDKTIVDDLAEQQRRKDYFDMLHAIDQEWDDYAKNK